MKLRIILKNMAHDAVPSLTLDQLAAGAAAVVDAVIDVDATILRLLEMGLTEGTPLVVTRRAPLGDPLEVQVRDTRLCLRAHEARKFRVSAAAVRP